MQRYLQKNNAAIPKNGVFIEYLFMIISIGLSLRLFLESVCIKACLQAQQGRTGARSTVAIYLNDIYSWLETA